MIDNPRIAAALLRHCADQGVREYCLAAGARNAPLALTLLGNQGSGCQIYHFFDERAAGFFALGRSLSSRRPVSVITTSGTAVAELLPAMVEAHYQAVPLIAITADRPPSFRGSGAPQAIEQPGIFGNYAATFEVGDEGLRGIPCFEQSPLHLNVPFDEPAPAGEGAENAPEFARAKEASKPLGIGDEETRLLTEFVARGDLAAVVGSLHPEEAGSVARFLKRLGAPASLEPASNLRGNPSLRQIECPGSGAGWVALLGRTKRILRIGGVPVGRWWRDLENTDHEILNLSPSGYPGISRFCASVRVGDFSQLDGVQIQPADLPDDGQAEDTDALLATYPRSEPSLIRVISKLVPGGDAVFLGNSLPVRDWDLAADLPRKGTAFFANRGANGIDGALSTALGIGVDYPGIWAVVGDLTALYDLSAPWVVAQFPGGIRVRIVVVNNGGGRIFSHLPALAELDENENAVVQNRHGLGFGAWASMWELGHVRVGTPADLEALDESGIPDRAVIEVVPDEGETSAFWRQFRGR